MKTKAPVQLPEGLEYEKATRKPFPVIAVQVTMDNLEQTAKWCKGTVGKDIVKMMGSSVELPCVIVPGNGPSKGQGTSAIVGMYVVEHRGAFRAYRADQYASTFDVQPKPLDIPQPLNEPKFSIGQKVQVVEDGNPNKGWISKVQNVTQEPVEILVGDDNTDGDLWKFFKPEQLDHVDFCS